MPIYGVHGTLNSQDNPLASVDSTGAMERAVQEQFDRPVVVMHLQGAGADVSPTGHGAIDCDNHPGDPADPCLEWLTSEGHGRAATPVIMAAWTAAGAAMRDALELEMVSRSIETGPRPETFTIRGGALAYAPFDLARDADGVVMAGAALATPVDEYNAPVGAALCETDTATFPAGAMPGTEGLATYGSCIRLDVAAGVLGEVLDLDFDVDANHPVCSTTRTTISALRLGDTVIGTLPGEVSVVLADLARTRSPLDAAHTIVVGYAQGHVGYMLRPEDWVLGGYEPSVTFWGPLEAEYIEEQLAALWPLALTPAREDAAASGATKLATRRITDALVVDDPAPMAGTVPATVPVETWLRAGLPVTAQPLPQVARVSGLATFVFYGDDPLVATPKVTLQRETATGSNSYVEVTRHSGRIVDDGDLVIATTPQPLIRAAGQPQTHLWSIEWQPVPWLGAVGLDDLAKRAALPLGRYRFHVVGKSWTLDSQPFAVVAGGLTGTATRKGPIVSGTVALSAPKGYRLLSMTAPSNQPVAYGTQLLSLTFLAGTTTVATSTVTTDASGAWLVNNPLSQTGDRVRVTDAYGNSIELALPAA